VAEVIRALRVHPAAVDAVIFTRFASNHKLLLDQAFAFAVETWVDQCWLVELDNLSELLWSWAHVLDPEDRSGSLPGCLEPSEDS